MMACIGRNWSPLFKLVKYKRVVFDEVYILFHFNIILKHNGVSSTKKKGQTVRLPTTHTAECICPCNAVMSAVASLSRYRMLYQAFGNVCG